MTPRGLANTGIRNQGHTFSTVLYVCTFPQYNSKRPCNDLGRIVVAVVVISIIVLVIIIIIIIIISIMYLSLYLNKKSVWVYRAVYHQVQSLN